LLPKESYNGEVDFKKRSAFRIPGIIVTTILTLFFLILFLMKGLQLDQVTVDQFIMQTAWYVIPLLIIITLLIRQFKIN
jgi:succinate dehydrogenase hydrophobic anchor subunit